MSKITELTDLPSVSTDDIFPVVDSPGGTPVTKKVTFANFKTSLTLVKGDVGLGSVDNTSDAGKPVSTAQQTALDLKANLASPTFTGTVTLPAGQALTTPNIGAATATTVNKVTVTQPATNAVLTIVEGATLTVSANTTLSGTPLSNPMITLGDTIYGAAAGVATRLAGDVSNIRKFIRTLSVAGVATAPVWDTVTASDVGLGNVTNESKATMFTSPALTGTPTAPTASAGTNTTQLATTAFVTAINNNASYRTILTGSASHIAAKVAGNYALTLSGGVAAVGGTGTLYPQAIIAIRGADYPTINGIGTKLRIVAQLYTNNVAPTCNFTFGLHPVTRPAASGGAGVNIFTIGTVVTGSNGAVFTAPATDGLLSAVGSDFAIPADGHYAIVMVTTATIATSAHVHAIATLQVRNA